MKVVFISRFSITTRNTCLTPFMTYWVGLCLYRNHEDAGGANQRWGSVYQDIPYICRTYELGRMAVAEKLIWEVDVVIAGSAPEEFLRERIRNGKLLFRYSERPLRKGMEIYKYLPRLVKWHMMNPPGKPIYMLCASAYTAGDYRKFGLFKGRCYKWGYFPEVKRYADFVQMQAAKRPASILWAGRLIGLKHPDASIL